MDCIEALEASEGQGEGSLLEFSKFDINRVMKHGERLVGSSGAEYDLPDDELSGNVLITSDYTLHEVCLPSL